MHIHHRLLRNTITAIAALLLGVCAMNCHAADAASNSRVTLIAMSHTAMAITGNLRLINRPGTNQIMQVVFANGRALRLKDMGQGVYSVTPPANPVLLNGNRLCAKNVKYLTFSFGVHSVVSMQAYDGPMNGARNDCGSFNYKQK